MSSNFLSQAKATFDDVVFDTIFDENATYGDLLKLVVVLAAMIWAVFALLEPIILWLPKGPLKPRYMRIAELEYNRPDKLKEQKTYGVTSREEYDDYIAGYLPMYILAITTHITGGMCTIPFVFGLTRFSTSVRSSIACLGILIEMAWEVQDFGKLIIHRKEHSWESITYLCLHHTLTCSMGLPMILNYRELPELHRMCFDLQLGAGLSLLIIELCRPLDVTKINELRKFVFMTVVLALITTWSRLFDWIYLVYKMLTRFYADENWIYLVVGGIVMVVFSLVNFFMLYHTLMRLRKFATKWKQYESLPAEASETMRRSSISDLQSAAADMTAIETRFEDAIVNMIVFGFEDRRVERRQTYNPATLSRSAALAAASAAGPSTTLRPHRQSMTAWRGLPSREKQRSGEQPKMD